jgi:DNA-binding NtrC family response regulator
MVPSLELIHVDPGRRDLPLSLESLERAGYRLEVCRVADAAGLRTALADRHFDFAMCASHLPGWDARSVLVLLRREAPALPVIAAGPEADDDTLVAWMRAGVFAVVRDADELLSAVRRGLERAEGPGRMLEAEARILLVDDEEAVLRVARRLLQRAGYAVTGFHSAERALGYFREHPQSFDLVITDYSLERRSGLALAAELRKLRPWLPVLLMTGYGGCFDFQSARGTSVSGVIQKPFRGRDLLNAVKQALESAAAERWESRVRGRLAGPTPRS